MDPDIAETVELIKPAIAAEKYFFKSAINLAFEFGAASHAGLCRAENQDHYLVVRRRRTQELLLSNVPKGELVLPPDESFGMAVADGMSGTSRGDLASRLAIRTAWELAGRTTSWIMKLADLNTHELSERVEGFTYMMQKAFEEEVEANPEFADSGTTWTLPISSALLPWSQTSATPPAFSGAMESWGVFRRSTLSSKSLLRPDCVRRSPANIATCSPAVLVPIRGMYGLMSIIYDCSRRPIALMHGRTDGLGRPRSHRPMPRRITRSPVSLRRSY